MEKKLFALLLSLATIAWLFGEFSISASPNGHLYSPRYDQSEVYSEIPTATSLTIDNTLSVATINATIINSIGSVLITIKDIALFQNFRITIDGETIPDHVYSIVGCDVIFSQTISLGSHTIAVSYILLDPDLYPNAPWNLAASFSFIAINGDVYYQNELQYAKIFPITNSLSSHDAIRPALFVEGFSAPGIIEGGANYSFSIISKWQHELTDTKVYMLQLTNPIQDVRDNAMIVLGALRFIHNIQPTNQLLEGTSVFGYSMGGILARYALAFAEHWDIPHYCTQYISLDAPHRGVSLNQNMQSMIINLKTHLDDWNHSDDLVDGCIAALESQTLRQLLRLNTKVDGWDNCSYASGTEDFNAFYSEINEEERSTSGHTNCIINSNQSDLYSHPKPGFPYKQNNIKSLGYSNGSLGASGNTQTSSTAAEYELDVTMAHYHFTADACEYDKQPGSVIDDVSTHRGGVGYQLDLIANYAPVLVPTRSSLYLKLESVTGGEPIQQLAINEFSSLAPYENMLQAHTFFDQLVFSPNAPTAIDTLGFAQHGEVPHYDEFSQWNWKHGELGWSDYTYDNWVESNISASDNWLDQPENRAVCFISGHVTNYNSSLFDGTMFINGIEYQEIVIDPQGNYKIPYLYTRDSEIKLVFEQTDCLTIQRDISLHYNDAMLQNYTVMDATMHVFNPINAVESPPTKKSVAYIRL